ncbi:AAA family ATPase [Streptomyces sp. NPDC005423]|uniref:AAA family ATPase n=1 Tax=Streptomyces sp. NPDC005423 TaxID=3155343 RepID=UPI00339DE537
MRAEPDQHGALPRPLYGREAERAVLAGAMAEARAGHPGAVLVVGEPGSGRSALLAEAARTADGFTVCRTDCAESEARLPLSALHRSLPPLANRAGALPAAETGALERILTGRLPSPEQAYGAGLTLLRVLTAASANRPLLWCVDDAHWLDEASLRALEFALARLESGAVAVVLAADPGSTAEEALDGVATLLRPTPLDRSGALRLLRDRCRVEPAARAAACALDLAAGNPLALVELAAALADAPADAAPALPAWGRLRTRHRRRLRLLSDGARTVVCLALVGDGLPARVLLAAAARAGTGPGALDEARASGLVAVDGDTVTVPGRLLMNCLSAETAFADRQAAHTALAHVLTDTAPRLPRAVHRLAAASRPSPRLVRELDEAAAAARGTGDQRAAAAALERAAEVAVRPETRSRWLVTAAADRLAAGESAYAGGLLHRVLPRDPDPVTRGLRMMVRGEIELRDGLPARARTDLSSAVGALPRSRPELTARALILAGEAACLAGDFAGYFSLAERARRLGTPDDPPAVRLVSAHFAGMAATFRGHHDEASRALRRVVRLAGAVRDPEATTWASQAAYTLGDAHRAHTLALTAEHQAREAGAVSLVPGVLVYQALSSLMLDRHAAAENAATEGLRLARSLGQRNVAVDHLAVLALLSALQGDGISAALRLRTAAHDVAARELGRPSAFNCWVAAVVDLVEGRPADALDRFRHMTAGAGQINLAIRGMAAPQFVEAAVRCSERDKAAGALRGFENWAVASGSTTRRALAHRCHGLLAEGHAAAEEHFREALRLHDRGDAALERAKTELFFAHRLRQARRPGAARGLLRDALAVFRQAEARVWAERAADELRAAGESRAAGDGADRPPPRGGTELTAQQARICDLVSRGATNREIADLLVLSTRTVEYHLRNIFVRLGVRSRVELASLFR